ncbi:MAG: molybdenum cofactor guanylyltransferase [Deltaproteobacteria bacterium]|nr:molybdenum cofactor guanylyltransferase [Deltaproteobacteria bacterium]
MILRKPQSDSLDQPIQGVTGVILAGGKSRRYGTNKALVEFDGAPLIAKVCDRLQSVFPRILLVTNTPEEYAFLHFPMVGDRIKGLGPIGGIYSGLCALTDSAGFFVACDMPFLNRDLIRHMVHEAGESDAVVPKIDWMIEPLHALYTKKCIPAIEAAIHSGKYQTLRFLGRVRVLYMEENELRGLDPELRSFTNVNSPEDLRRLMDQRG